MTRTRQNRIFSIIRITIIISAKSEGTSNSVVSVPQSLARVDLRQKFFPCPSRVPAAEEDDQNGSQGQTDIADEPVFEIQNRAFRAQRVDVPPDVEPENAGKGENPDDEEIHPCRFSA